MSPNKQTVQEYMDAYNALDHKRILACLTEDVEWIVPGAFHHKGKAAFDKEIENPSFEGKPEITVIRLIEEKNIVVAEGFVKTKKKGESPLLLAFCDVFEMQNSKIKRLTSYLMPA